MHDQGKQLLSLMFRPGETVCVSHNQFGYHSIPLENAMDGIANLVPTPDSLAKRKLTLEEGIERIPTENLLLAALNPINGYRNDQNCTAYRNFLVEVDYGPLAEQLAYMDRLGLPYSAVVFSGNKSLHFLVSLDRDLPDEKTWRTLSEWMLNIATLADQNTKNPSRSIRIPGAMRDTGKMQQLARMKGPTSLSTLIAWLKNHPKEQPKEKEKRVVSGEHDLSKVKEWCKELLFNGLDPTKGRNKQWFSIACEFALAGFSEDDTMDVLSKYFTPDRDFKEREWKTCIRSGFNKIHSGN